MNENTPGKSKTTAGFFALFLGFIGMDYFYCNKKGIGSIIVILYLCSAALLFTSTHLKKLAQDEEVGPLDYFASSYAAGGNSYYSELMQKSMEEKIEANEHWKAGQASQVAGIVLSFLIGFFSIFRAIRYFYISEKEFDADLMANDIPKHNDEEKLAS